MSEPLTIQQWYARAVAAGLVPDWGNVFACWYDITKRWAIDNGKSGGETISTIVNIPPSNNRYCNRVIQLRKDGIDLVELEWRKPTEEDIDKMCWLLHDGNISLTKLTDLWDETEHNNEIMYHSTNIDSCLNSDEYKILLATNGNIAPKPEDFRKVYGEV